MMRGRSVLPLILVALASLAARQSPALPPKSATPSAESGRVPRIPDYVPPSATRYSVLVSGSLAGNQLVWTTVDRKRHVLFQFNDRGRGPMIYTVTVLGPDGLPVSIENSGHDYFKGPVDEKFTLENRVARWKNKAEAGERAVRGAVFFPSFFGPPDEIGLLTKFLARNGKPMPLLPEGEARVERVRELTIAQDGKAEPVVLYALTGFEFTPTYVWLDSAGELFAFGGRWTMTIREGAEKSQEKLAAAQDEASIAWRSAVAKTIARTPAADVAIHDVSVFDSRSATLRRNQSVMLRGGRIVSVASSGPRPRGTELVDGAGATLLPGLWDMHTHLGDASGLLNVAAGVTTVRDMGSDIDELEGRRKRFDSGLEIGPRVIAAGFIDSRSPYQAPTRVLVDTEQEVRDAIARYAALGYPQIKVYSSIRPELVPVIVAEAHRRGMRVSGHVPATMFADEFVRAGADELQHVNFLFLNFFRDVTETRTPARFTEPGKRAAGLDLSSPPVQEFIALLRERNVVVDPTLATFESLYRARPGVVDPAFEAVVQRMPTQLRRGFLAGGLPAERDLDATYRKSYDGMIKMVGLLHRSGVRIVAGTDTMAGFGLHRELELYVDAGIPAPEVLRLATLGSAQVMKRDAELGAIEEGKLADLVLVAGDPTRDISAIRRTKLVVKNGTLYDPARIYEAIGVKP